MKYIATAVAVALLWNAGCAAVSDTEPEACDVEARRPHADKIESMPAVARDTLARALHRKSRIQDVQIAQEACHFWLIMRMEPSTNTRYARSQAEALLRQVKRHAPNETPPLEELVGQGLYDYVVIVERDTVTRWIRGSKMYDAARVSWSK